MRITRIIQSNANRQLCPTKNNYSPTDGEALGIIYSCKKFRHYLLKYKVVFHMDHSSLKYLVNQANLTGRIARWVMLLQEFNYKVRVRSRRGHTNADFFSRLPRHSTNDPVDDDFPDEDLFQVQVVQTKVVPNSWYTDIIMFLSTLVIPHSLN